MTPRIEKGWLLRVASQPHHGGGHVSRSAALAQALAADAPVTMLLDRGGEGWRPVLSRRGIESAVAGGQGDGPWAGVVFDGYEFSEDEMARLASNAVFVAAIDDHMDPPACAQLAINPAIGLAGDNMNGMPALLGAAYALIDPRFAGIGPSPIRQEVNHVLICFGTIDPDNATEFTLAEAREAIADRPDLRITVVIGSGARHLSSVRRAVDSAGAGVRLLVDHNEMPKLFADIDLAIGAGGVGLLERLAAGLASVTLSIADNQNLAATGAAETGATLFAGGAGQAKPGSVRDAVRALVADPKQRRDMSERARSLVDGRGAMRVAAALIECARTGDPATGLQMRRHEARV